MFELSKLPQPKPPISSGHGHRTDAEKEWQPRNSQRPNQVFSVMRVFAMALQPALAAQRTQALLWLEGLGPHGGEFPVLSQISESEDSLPRDLAAGWSWLCETVPQNLPVFLLPVSCCLHTTNTATGDPSCLRDSPFSSYGVRSNAEILQVKTASIRKFLWIRSRKFQACFSPGRVRYPSGHSG